MENTLLLNDILPTPIKKIESGSELILFYELHKYVRKYMDKELQLGDVKIIKALHTSEEFSFVVNAGVNVGVSIPRADLSMYKPIYFFTKTVESVALVSSTPELVKYWYDTDTTANAILHGENRARAYISLVAYFMVKSHIEGVKCPLIDIGDETYNPASKEYSELYILQNYGNKILEGLIKIELKSAWGLQTPYESFIIFNRQLGHMKRPYVAGEKAKYLTKNFQIGDVVLFYTRKKGAKGVQFNPLTSCYPAVIIGMTATDIRLRYYPIIETRQTRLVRISDTENELLEDGKSSFYSDKDYTSYYDCVETYRLTDIGIDKMTWDEDVFILEPGDFDGTHQYVRDADGQKLLFFSGFDTIYAVFTDRKVEYNKERFLEKYFQNRTPLYDLYYNEAGEQLQKRVQ